MEWLWLWLVKLSNLCGSAIGTCGQCGKIVDILGNTVDWLWHLQKKKLSTVVLMMLWYRLGSQL